MIEGIGFIQEIEPIQFIGEGGGVVVIPPSNISAPAISGQRTTGSVLTASNGTWDGTIPISYSYVWSRNGVVIPGATSPGYTLVSADESSTIEVIVTASNSAGSAAEKSLGIFPIPLASYLPSVGTAPAAAYGMRRLVTAYSGSLFQAQRASDNATMDVAQDSNGLPDFASVATWAAGSQVRIKSWYDQTGQGRHSTGASWAVMPIFDAAGIRGQAAAFAAFKAAVFDGWLDVPNGNTRRPKRLTLPTSVAYNFQTNSIFIVIDPKSSQYNSSYISLARSSGGSEATAAGTAVGINGVYTSGGGAQVVSGRRPRQQMQVLGFVSGASAFKFFQNGQIVSTANKWTDPLAGGIIGDSISAVAEFMSFDNWLGFVLYPATLSDTNAGLVRDSLNNAFGIKAPTGAIIVQVGDSIQYGPTVTESLEGRTNPRLIRPLLKGSPALNNMGLSNQRLVGDMASNAATREFLMADVAYAKRILFIEIGTNDIGAQGGTVGYGATLYSALTTYIGNARAAGYTHIVVRTLLPRSQSSQQIIEMASYNSLVRANSAGADAISDAASHPVMGDPANLANTLYYQDQLHPTGYGNELLAPLDAAAINSVL